MTRSKLVEGAREGREDFLRTTEVGRRSGWDAVHSVGEHPVREKVVGPCTGGVDFAIGGHRRGGERWEEERRVEERGRRRGERGGGLVGFGCEEREKIPREGGVKLLVGVDLIEAESGNFALG